MVAAHFTPKDVNLWKRLAGLSTEVGYLRQAIYCLSHVIRHDRHDVAPQWDRALLYAEVCSDSAPVTYLISAMHEDGSLLGWLMELWSCSSR